MPGAPGGPGSLGPGPGTAGGATGTGGAGVFVGGPKGVYRAADQQTFVAAANRETRDLVAIPETWLFCSGEHDIEVVSEDATSGD